MKALSYSYLGRKRRKRDFRRLWICRINDKTREYGISYSEFQNRLKISKIDLNLKILSQLILLDKKVSEHLFASIYQ